ncbi:MAG TPA: zinc ABC transporter permease [Cytophagales bacterium]|jgi:manganese/zinc/iron transport system permease protein|nr:zinc ABC transporter permease [Cytophagales bacterium]
MYEQIIDFLSLSDPNVRTVVLGSILLTSSSAIIGAFTFLRKKALVGDAVAHSVLPGICLAFMIGGAKDPLILIPGAFLAGWLSMILIDKITLHSRIKEDTAIGMVLSVTFGLGILMLTFIQHSGNANQSGLDHFLFGKAAAMLGSDVIIFSAIALLMVLTVSFLFKEFALVCFDREYASSMGLPVKRLDFLMTSLTVLAVVIGIQAVGVVLMAAMLITPAAAARFWTDNLKLMIIMAAVIGAVSGFTGALVSYLYPSMPTGPWIVVVASVFAFISFFFAPKKGILQYMIKQRRIRLMINEENIIKAGYHIGEDRKDFTSSMTATDLIRRRPMPESKLKGHLAKLTRQGYFRKHSQGWELTNAGYKKGSRLVRIHRLWELYLTEYLNIASDHVHEDAETIEHFITPELEKQLEQTLNYPSEDPHQSKIPYE